MSIFGYPISIDIVLLAAFLLLALIAIGTLAALLRLREEWRTFRQEQRAWQKRMTREVAVNSPTRAAIAAVLATRGDDPPSLETLEREISALMTQWGVVEELADKARGHLVRLVDAADGAEKAGATEKNGGRHRKP